MDRISYEDLVTYRNSLKPKYMEFLRMVLDHPVALGAATDSFIYAFDVDNAVGVNLDTVGALVGVDRVLPFVPATGSRYMNDDEYRALIRLGIARNVWDGRNETVNDIYRSIFPQLNVTYVDKSVAATSPANMTVEIHMKGDFPFRLLQIFAREEIHLIPAGVKCDFYLEGESVTYKVYTGVAQHGELMIERIGGGYRTWGDIKQMTWGEAKEVTWGDLLSGQI